MANPAEYLHIKQGNLLYAIGCAWQVPPLKFVKASVSAIALWPFIYVSSGILALADSTPTSCTAPIQPMPPMSGDEDNPDKTLASRSVAWRCGDAGKRKVADRDQV